jgi:hypothetical protein
MIWIWHFMHLFVASACLKLLHIMFLSCCVTAEIYLSLSLFHFWLCSLEWDGEQDVVGTRVWTYATLTMKGQTNLSCSGSWYWTLSESIIRFSLLFYWKFYLVHFNPGQTISPVTNPNRKLICPKIKNTTHNVNSKPLYRFLFSIQIKNLRRNFMAFRE